MKYPLLRDEDKKAINALKESYGGAKNISQMVREMRNYEKRKEILGEKGFGEMTEKAEEMVSQFPRLKSFEEGEDISYNDKLGIVITQVSGFQGQDATFRFMERVVESARSKNEVFAPAEMISIMALTEEYVYEGGLLATLAMTENLIGVDKFCNTNFVSTPLSKKRFKAIEDATGMKFPTIYTSNELHQIQLINQGTPYGNLGGIEISNYNFLIYIDGIIRTLKSYNDKNLTPRLSKWEFLPDFSPFRNISSTFLVRGTTTGSCMMSSSPRGVSSVSSSTSRSTSSAWTKPTRLSRCVRNTGTRG